jgi:hypothetical protein
VGMFSSFSVIDGSTWLAGWRVGNDLQVCVGGVLSGSVAEHVGMLVPGVCSVLQLNNSSLVVCS